MEKTLIHVWHHFHECGAQPIHGKRFHCNTCLTGPDNDLCEECYEKLLKGKIKHPPEGTLNEIRGYKEHCFVALDGSPDDTYKKWLEVFHPEVMAPDLPDHFVMRPVFTAGIDSTIGGYAFAVKMESWQKPVLLTALHVMDEIIKKNGIDCSGDNREYTGKELPKLITKVEIYDLFATNWMLSPLGMAGPMMVLPDARTGDEEPYSFRDIAAFWIWDTHQVNAVSLASKVPKLGEPIWQAARSLETTENLLHKAVVVETTDRSLIFKYENQEEELTYTSGSPWLDRNGDVVGITVGGGKYKGQRFGHANHVGNIRRHLSNAT